MRKTIEYAILLIGTQLGSFFGFGDTCFFILLVLFNTFCGNYFYRELNMDYGWASLKISKLPLNLYRRTYFLVFTFERFSDMSDGFWLTACQSFTELKIRGKKKYYWSFESWIFPTPSLASLTISDGWYHCSASSFGNKTQQIWAGEYIILYRKFDWWSQKQLTKFMICN